MKLSLFFLVLFLLFFSNFTFYINAGENNNNSPFIYYYPPENSFGISSYQYINWSYFDDRFFYETNVQELEVEWDKSNDFVSKFKYKIKTDVYGLYFLNISFIDDNVQNVLFDELNNTFEIVYQDGGVFFNFTDIILSTEFEYNYEIYSNGWKLILFNNLLPGEMELDPSFGSSASGETTNLYFSSNNNYYLHGIPATMGSNDGICDNITFYIATIDENAYFTGYIYEYIADNNAGDKLATTDSVLVTSSDDNTLVVLPFSGAEKICLDAYEDYQLVVHTTTSGLSVTMSMHKDTGFDTRVVKSNAGSPVTADDPLTGEGSSYGYPYILCYYTEGCGVGCTNETLISTNSTSNNSVNIDFCDDLNYTVDLTINSDCGCSNIDFVNISCDVLGVYSNSTNVGNGTYNLTLPNLVCGTQYQVNVSAMSCNGSINNSYFLFTTRSCCDTTIEKLTNSTLNNYDYNLTYLNLSGLICINSTCNTTLQYINASVKNQNFTNLTNIGEGCNINLNITDLNLSCGTTYILYINTSSKNCSSVFKNNTWYNLNTSSCPIVCNCILDDIFPANKTISLNWSGVNYLNITIDINITCGNFTGAYGNITVLGIGYSNTSLSANGTIFYNMSNNYTCSTNYTILVNLTSPNCVNKSIFWFTTESCNITGVDPCDLFNYSCFTEDLENYLTTHGYIKESDTMEIELTSSFLSIFLTLVLFLLFFIYGYTVDKRSAGAFLMFSGFILLSLEYLTASYLHSITIALLGVFAIFIIILGVRKWLYPAGKEKTRTEGQ